jgi:predicted enzyme related to lactoylglutathione lyase
MLSLLCAPILLACSGQQYNLPAVTAAGNGALMPGKIIWHDLLTSTPAQTQAFYGDLFGWAFEPMPEGVNYTLIRHGGNLIGGMVDSTRLPRKPERSQWVVGLSVTDIGDQVDVVRAGGGEVFTEPTSLGERGRIAVVADPGMALLALLETSSGDPVDSDQTPATGDFLWHELWTADVEQISRFYRGIAPLVEEKFAAEGATAEVDYRLLSAHGRPRFGVRSLPDAGMSAAWVSYLRVADEAELASLLARVEKLGGRVLVPATPRPLGGSVAVIAGPSGAGIALQTWPNDGGQNEEEEAE